MVTLSKWLTYLFYAIIGKWVVTKHTTDGRNSLLFEGDIKGYSVKFFCQDIVYIMHFDRRFIPDKKIRSYRFSTVIDDTAPSEIKEKCKEVIFFPDFSPSFLLSTDKKKHMLNVYLDVINLKTT